MINYELIYMSLKDLSQYVLERLENINTDIYRIMGWTDEDLNTKLYIKFKNNRAYSNIIYNITSDVLDILISEIRKDEIDLIILCSCEDASVVTSDTSLTALKLNEFCDKDNYSVFKPVDLYFTHKN